MRKLMPAAMLLTLVAAAAAQTPARPAPAVSPTIPLVISDPDPAAQKAVRVSAADTLLTLNGPLAQVTTTLVFANALDRPLEGELEFPLTEGATLSGYALDVPAGSGILVDGVPVEKVRARQILEAEERVRVDPGLVEHTVGNNFKTRLYPLPANGTRTIRITYVMDTAAVGNKTTCTLFNPPLGQPDHASLRVEVVGDADPAAITITGLDNLAFKKDAGKIVAEKTLTDAALPEKIAIALPAPADPLVRIEHFDPALTADDLLAHKTPTGDRYFLLSAMPAVPPMGPPVKPNRIGVLWDTSLSRAREDHGAELAVLQKLMALVKDVGVDLMTTDSDKVTEIDVRKGDASALLNTIKALTYDGALQVDDIALQHTAKIERTAGHPLLADDEVLLFSDGLVTLGKPAFQSVTTPVFTIANSPRADHTTLRRLAENAGGLYLNLARLAPDAAATTLLTPPVTVTLDGDGITDVYPRSVALTGSRVLFTGKLTKPEVAATLHVGRGSQQIVLRGDDANTGMIGRYWAGQKIADLSADAGRNADELAAVGKAFNLVTPNTSLLVLETADQYVKYRVVPPKTSTEIYAEFTKRIEDEGIARKKTESEKIDRVLALWNTRVQWWEKAYTYPQNFVYQSQGGPSRGVNLNSAPRRALDAVAQSHGVEAQTVSPAAPAAATPVPAENSLFATGSGLADRKIDNGASEQTASISIKGWDPQTPYLKAMKGARDAYGAYLVQRNSNFDSPSFYLDCGSYLIANKQPEQGIRVLTNIAQLRLEDAALLRVAAYRLEQVGAYDVAIDLFEKAKLLRPDEPQSFRDLAQALAARGMERRETGIKNNDGRLLVGAYDDLNRSLELYRDVVMKDWERFPEIEVIALMEANEVWARVKGIDAETGGRALSVRNPLDPRLVKNLDCDVRIVMTWDADETDIDLHVKEPSGEEAFYGHNLTTIGGMVSKDFTQGYGPEEYCLRRAMPGVYTIETNYFGSRSQKLMGPVTVQATVITHFGRPDEKRESLTLRLSEQKETVEIGKITIK